MDALSLYLPAWSADRVRRARRLDARRPIVLTTIDHERTVVAARCVRTARAGVTIGMPWTQARAMLPSGVFPPHAEPWSAVEDTRALRRLARWAYRFVPIVALDGTDGLLLDARGCGALYRGVERLVDRLAAALGRAGIVASLAAAPTFAGAWALARYGGAGRAGRGGEPLRAWVRCVDRAHLEEHLAPLPLAALRLEPGVIADLNAVGVLTIAQLRAMPRLSLAARFGNATLAALDRATGSGVGAGAAAAERVTPLRFPSLLRIEHQFDGPTDRPETIGLAVRDVLDRLCIMMRERGRGCLSLLVLLQRSDLASWPIRVRLARPSRDRAHLWKLLLPKLESAHLGFGVCGVEAMVARAGPLGLTQNTCWTGTNARAVENAADVEADILAHAGGAGALGEEARAQLVDLLVGRLGHTRVCGLEPRASHVPERAFGIRSILELGDDAPGKRARGKAQVTAGDASAASHRPAPLPHGDRPTRLFEEPREIEVMLRHPDGPVMHMRERDQAHEIAACEGPEHIAGEWWRGCAEERAYFKVRTAGGRWLWIYRENAGRRWFWQGEWC